jgi:hypothetical protein
METLKSLDVVASKLLQQLPVLMQQGTLYASELYIKFIKYSFAINWFYLIIGIVFIIIGIFLFYVICHLFEETGGTIASLLFFIPGLVIVINCIHNLVQLSYMPELYLINYFN